MARPLAKLEQWMCDEELTLRELAEVLGMSAQCLHRGIVRGTFARGTIAKLVQVAPLSWDDFLLPTERRAVRSSLKRWERRAA